MPFDPAAEAYGRSLAAGVATLDLYLYATLQGFSPLNYFALRTGPNEASHTLFARDYRPHPAWQSLELRNRFASGDMLQTVTNSAPTADVAGTDDTPSMTDVPLVASYAFRDGDTYSVIVISRKFSGTTPVTLRLPFNSAETVTRHSLSGDPTATNVPALNIAPQQTAVHDFFSDVYSFSIPPSSATVFVFDGVSNAPTPDEVLVALPGETVILSLPSFLPVDDTAPDFLWTKHPDATTVLSTERELIISSAALTDAGTYVLDYNDGTGPAQYVIQLQVLAVVPALGFGGLLAGVLLLIVVAVSLRTRLGLRS